MMFDGIGVSVFESILLCWCVVLHFKKTSLAKEASTLRSENRDTQAMIMDERLRRQARNKELWEAIGALKKSVAEDAKK